MARFEQIMYTREDYNFKFEEFLEKLDPSRYTGTPFENTTAFQRQLRRFDIKNTRYIDQFYQNEMTGTLFLEWICKQVIDVGRSYDLLYTDMCIEGTTADDFIMNEKTYSSEISFKLSDTLAKLRNELRVVGKQFQQDQIYQILDTISGNNSENPVKLHKFPTVNKFRMDEEGLAKIFAYMYPYTCTHIFLSEDLFWQAASSKILYSDVQNSALDMQETHSFSTPYGTIVQAPTNSNRQVIAIDANIAMIRKYFPETVYIDKDKLLDKQKLELSAVSGYRLLCSDAVKIFQF